MGQYRYQYGKGRSLAFYGSHGLKEAYGADPSYYRGPGKCSWCSSLMDSMP